MGWLFTSQSREALIATLLQPQESDRARSLVLAHALAGDILWSVVQLTAKEAGFLNLGIGESLAVIRCDLLEGSADGWGYKSLDESSHPYYYSCPLQFLEMAPVQSAEWRAQVRAFHAR